MSILNLNELIKINTERCHQKIMFQKSPKMDLIFDPLLGPHRTVRSPTDHRVIGMTTYYGIKFKNAKNVENF